MDKTLNLIYNNLKGVSYPILLFKLLFKHIFLLILFIAFTFKSARSQQKDNTNTNLTSIENWESGLPYIENYTPKDYGAATDNWSIVQDSLGILYFANGNGILSYDGKDWDVIQLPNIGSVLALAIDEKGKIYVGGANEMGYLEPNAIGQLEYVSLMPYLPKKHLDLNNIRKIHITDDGIIFGSETSIYQWKDNTFKVWKLEARSWTFYEKGIVYVKINEKGLMKLIDGQLELVTDGDFFKNMKVTTITTYDENRLLVSTIDRFFLYDGKKFDPFVINNPNFFEENTIYHVNHLSDGTIAIATLQNGILFIDRQGNKQIILSQKGVLHSKQITYLFQDNSGILWATSFSGIAKIEYPSPFTYFNSNNNAPDFVVGFQRYNDKLYVASSEGLFYIDKKGKNKRTVLTRIKTNFGTITDLRTYKGKLLVSTGEGVFEMDKNELTRKLFNGRVQTLCVSKLDSNRVFIGLYPGFTSIYNTNEQWVEENRSLDISFRSVKISEDKKGTLWLTTDKNEAGRISFNNLKDAKNNINPTVKVFNAKDGFPNSRGFIYIIENEVYFKANDGVYLFNSQSQQFRKDEELYKKIGLENKAAKINLVDENENIWLFEYDQEDNRLDQLIAFKQKDNSYLLKSLQEKRIINKKNYRPVFYESKDSVIWYKGKPGIIRHDLRKTITNSSLESKAHISKVIWNNDSLLFGGYSSSIVHELPFNHHQLRFQYSSTSFIEEADNQFQYLLEGFDDDWSEWTSETKKDYTNIPQGDYSFKVRSKNIFNQISQEDHYFFNVLPPWYKTWWAYIIYGLGMVTLLFLILQWRSKELQKKNENLEHLIYERTTEIQHKNELLNHQTEQLVQLNDSKTRLYSNITHEFRTPLTVILGMADNLKTNIKAESFEGVEKSLDMIHRNGKSLLHLVNEMLDLAKVESGSMQLNLVQTDAIPFVKYLSESFHSLAESKKINLTVYSEISTLEMDIDVNKMASIISNLLSNAVKFTSAHGKIIVHLNKILVDKKELFSLKVQDNGLGLTEEDIIHLFDRFYQVDNASIEKQQGTGIGLSLAKEFVELMSGTITVNSTLGKGSTFIVQIPVTNNATKTIDAKITVEPPIQKTTNIDSKLSAVSKTTDLPLALIIEDNEDVAHYLRTCLNGKYQTEHANNGNEGIEMAYANIPDIIISDVMMPGKDGLQVCSALKTDERTDHIPIILLTAKVTPKDRLTGLSHGADAYLAKPFNEEELFIRLNQLILTRKKLVNKIQKNGLHNFLNKRDESPETKFLKKVIQLIHEDIHNSTFGSAELANKLHLSESQIYRKLKAVTGKSTAVFIRSVRLQKAKELILTTDKTISEIAYDTGFNDPSWFSRAFKDEFGSAPKNIHK